MRREDPGKLGRDRAERFALRKAALEPRTVAARKRHADAVRADLEEQRNAER